jgi:hypothetical protein
MNDQLMTAVSFDKVYNIQKAMLDTIITDTMITYFYKLDFVLRNSNIVWNIYKMYYVVRFKHVKHHSISNAPNSCLIMDISAFHMILDSKN